jgi:NCS1 family nucleobase:cation symporter-1
MYTGPFTKMLGGADISWIVSLVVTALVYYPLAKKTMSVPRQMIYPADQAPMPPTAATARAV